MSTIEGVDLSFYQGTDLNYRLMKASGIEFAAVKVTEGTGYTNPDAVSQINGLRAAGIQDMFYCYLLPTLDPEPQAQYFSSVAKPLAEVGTSVWLDHEVGASDQSPRALRWLRAAGTGMGFKPAGIYSDLAFFLEHLTAPSLAAYACWVAAWGSTPPAPPKPWTLLSVWQNSDRGNVAGVPAPLDTDVFFGTVEQLRALGKPAPAPLPQPKHFELVVAQHFRPLPDVNAKPWKRLLPAGTRVVEIDPPPQYHQGQNGMVFCRTNGGVSGWLWDDASHLEEYQP